MSISDKLDHDTISNPNKNYNIIDTIITSLITKHFPTKTVKFNKHKNKNNSWTTKQKYYHTIFDKYKNNIKGTWSTIKSLLNRVIVKSQFPDYIMIENKLVSDKSTISNKFNEFYKNIGLNLAKVINIARSKSFRSSGVIMGHQMKKLRLCQCY